MIDLHMHSNYSDGSMSPVELVREAKELGLTAIALTDHDTMDGVLEFEAAGKELNITTVLGVEISIDTKLPNNGHMHLLGLFIDPYSRGLKSKLDFLLDERNKRAGRILDALRQLGVDISLEELQEEAGEGSIGRPHVAKILVRNGIVPTIQEAFDVYLAKGQPAYVDKVKFDEAEAIALVKAASGLAILAHPHFMGYDEFSETERKIINLKELGLDGFEAHYSGMPAEFSQKLLRLAEEHNFAISGGTDYHGENKPLIKMGTGKDDLQIEESVLTRLQLRKDQHLQLEDKNNQ